MIIQVNVVLNRTIANSDWHFDNLCNSHMIIINKNIIVMALWGSEKFNLTTLMSFFIWILWFFVLVKEVFYFNSTTHLIWTLSLVPSVITGFDCYSSRKFMEISQENIMCVDNSWHFVTLPLVTQNKRRHLIPWAYSGF